MCIFLCIIFLLILLCLLIRSASLPFSFHLITFGSIASPLLSSPHPIPTPFLFSPASSFFSPLLFSSVCHSLLSYCLLISPLLSSSLLSSPLFFSPLLSSPLLS